MKRFIFVFILSVLFAGCEGDYDFGKNPYVKKAVVMSVINPDSLMQVKVYWNMPAGSMRPFDMIEGAEVEIKEDGDVVFSGQTDGDGLATASVYPSAGKKYSLLVKVDGWPDMTASTEIPQPASITYSTRAKTGGWASSGYILADVSGMAAPENVRAVWLTACYEYEDGRQDTFYSDLYSMCAFLDQLNATTDPDDISLRESNVIYEDNFIRIQRSALELAAPFTFSYSAWWYEWTSWNPEEPEVDEKQIFVDKAVIRLISPSDEYDKFRRSQYAQWASGWNSNPFMGDPVSVFSNIENGIGIFAGYNLAEYKQNIDNPAKP